MKVELFLSNWSDVLGESQEKTYIDYEALLTSDDEFLILTSIFEDGESYE